MILDILEEIRGLDHSYRQAILAIAYQALVDTNLGDFDDTKVSYEALIAINKIIEEAHHETNETDETY